VISTNLTGVFYCTQQTVRHMEKQAGGKIISICSEVAECGNIGQSNYSAVKGGLISFTKTIAKEYTKCGICAPYLSW